MARAPNGRAGLPETARYVGRLGDCQGHSLGGAYATLTYGEFLRRLPTAPFNSYDFGDLCTLGAPRTCLEPFASEVALCTSPTAAKKQLFRLVNQEDPVPTVPPPVGASLTENPFIHVGGAWRLTGSDEGGGAVTMGDEPPAAPPQPILDVIWNLKDHKLSDYYASWQKTDHS
ncbi:hypothetical protein C8Q78DRAFT_994997 [Trametes maxima]|nr:hypothetical protein C8Q78DRAFT_994997 [Trametes maxima]